MVITDQWYIIGTSNHIIRTDSLILNIFTCPSLTNEITLIDWLGNDLQWINYLTKNYS